MMVPVNNDQDLLGRDYGHNHSIGPRVDTNIPQQRQTHPSTPTEDLLGIDGAPQMEMEPSPGRRQRQQQQQVINATHATVSITTSAAPAIAGLGKIESTAQGINGQNKPKRKAIHVPTYACNGGLDTKFNHFARHARPSHLHGLLTPDEYEREIQTLNDKIKKARAKGVDVALLATGALIVPLALWGARHGRQVKRRRTLIEEGVWEFNERMGMDGRNVRMVWNRAKVVGGGESYLTIEEAEEGRGGENKNKFD